MTQAAMRVDISGTKGAAQKSIQSVVTNGDLQVLVEERNSF